NGAATDDGLPTGSTLSSLWNQLSGPGVTTFEDSAESQTVASFSEPGTYVLQLTASDTELTSRGEVTITVQPQNQPPLVAAGPDQVISLPNSAQLNGLVSDDGWPAGSNLTTAWSVVSGPGAVAFANASVTVTSVVFVVPGTYVLRLAVSDGELSASDDLSITVTPPNQAPTVNAGADQTIELPAAVLLKASFSDDGLPEGSNVSTTWSKASGPGDVLFSNPNSPITSATFCAAGIYVLRLSVTDSLLSNSDEVTVIVRGLQTLTLKSGNGEIGQPDQLNLASRDGGLTYQPAYVVERYDSSVYVPGTNFVWGLIPGSRWINFVPSHWMAGPLNWNAGPSTTKYRATFTFPSDYSQPSLFGRIEADDVATVFLNGTQIVSHSGFADPAGFVFTDDITRFQSGPNVVDITLFDSGGGVGGLDYKFQILSVTATPHANQPPTVNAGTSQIISLPNQASLMGGVRDDTLPCGGTLSVEWVKVSGPGAVVFGSAGSADGSASFSVTGTYVLRLSANDGELTAADEITIEVQPPNQAPLVNAGADQTIRQPEAATLNGSVTDDGRPSGQTLSAQWTKQSGPGNVTFLNVNTSITTASFSAAGTYVLRLTASDSILNASDDVVVTVYPLTTTCTNDDFADDFDDNTLDVTKWVIADPASTVSVREQNQRLEMILRPNTVAYNGVSSVATFDFRGKRFEVGVPQVTSVVGYTETFVTLSRDSGNYYLIDAGGGSLTLDAYTAGLRNRTVIDYNAASHRFWRIRHDSAANAINFETSKDGSAWTTGKTLAASFPLNAMKITLFAGAWGTGNGAPGLAAFDNVRLIPLVPNCLPSVSLSNPVNNSTFGAGANVVIEANASDSDGSVARVEFFSGNAKLGEATANPYRFTWNNVAEGHYSLRTRATDDRGAIADAEPIAITVIANRPPVVSAGQDQVVELPGEASLSGSVTDDGLPAGGGVTSVWSKVSGPGAVVFENVNAPPTTASFGAPGNYVIRLTASDTELVGSDDVTITVNPRNQPPLVSAGTDQVITLHGNLVENPGNEQASTNGAVAGWIAVEGAWTQGSESSGNGSPEPQRGNFYFFANGAQQAELRQDIDLSAYAGTIAAGTQQFEFRAYLRSAAEAAPDVARIIIEYRDTTNNNVIASLDSGAISSTSSWHLTEDTRTAPPGTGWISVRMLATRNSGTTNDAFFDSISLRPIDTVAVKLNGIVTDDGLPGGSSVSVHWTALGGPGPVTFANANTANSGAAFITPGTYVLRLVATDGQLSSNADVTVSVDPPNQPPLVNAGSNQTITLPALAALNGAITDDGFPRGATVALGWRRVAGPGDVAFANANSTTTTAGFSQPGIYILRLTADDGDYATTADVTINVDNPATNQPPVVSAGADQTLSQPADTLTLSGNVADDGLPAAHNLIVQWTQVNGPAAVIFGSLNNSVSIVRFSTPGTYLLRLSANDGELSTSDDVLVSVLAENYPPTIDAGPDQTTLLSQLVPLNGGVSDDGLPLAGSLTTSWTVVSGPDPVTFANANVRVTSAQFSSPGMYVLRLSATDGQLSASDEVNITVRENVAPPAVKITSPADGDSVTQPTAVAGSVSDGVWELEYSLASDDNTNNRIWTSFAGGDGMVSGDRLGTLDPTMMLNGLYDVRLTATDSYGQSSRTTASVIVERNFKVGNFTVSFTDLNVPLAGLPIEVSRTYDSRDKRVGDFGFGWTLGLRNVRLEKSGPLGLRWYETVSQEILPNYCLEATGSHLLTVTFAGGKVFKFQAVVTPRCQRVAPITTGTLTFASLPGTQGTLEVLGSSDFQVEGSIPGPVNLLGLSNGVDVLNSSVFKFTAEDGTAYVIDQRVGLQSISDTNGNTVTVTTGGLIHSGGKSISFTRDSLGRITQITPPAGNAPSYSYDARGDLASYTDAENNTSTYTYDSNHRLLSIRDPRGIEPIRNEYDADGRLVSHTDGFGKVISYDHDLAARVETVTDRLGNPTRFEYDERGNVLRKTDARGGGTSFTYDLNDNLLSETNALGRTTTYTYDANDHRTSTTDPLGITTEFTYNPLGKILTATDALGHTTINTYDGAGNLLSTRDALNNTTAFTYSPFDGQRTSLSDALDNVTRYEYSDGYLAKEKDALGNETTFT
ncbi:MAG TPA: hypothetical protein DCK99_01610, partial [Blastocatellia bacterium]|nr:hypothetical protein [Blastocatellia bacterium]